MKRVLLSTRLLPEGFAELQKQFEVVFPENETFTHSELITLLPQFDAFVPTFVYPVDREMLDAAAQRVKIISNYGVGYNNIDIDYAAQLGIVVTNTPDPVIEPTAELALALMLAAARRIPECDRKVRIPNGLKWGVLENLGQSLTGKTLGIVGMGRIGQALARRALACGMHIVYYNRHRLSPDLEATYKATLLDLDDLIAACDVLSLNTPLTDETHHLIGHEQLQQMKRTAIIINTARGAVIDEAALVEALQQGWIAAAGLDVYEFEPQITPALMAMDNVILAPHNGTATVDTRNEIARFASQNIIRFFEGREDITRVN
jgi:lactate dehydrogenase-like 2-hydroxyacid dehydrogenase